MNLNDKWYHFYRKRYESDKHHVLQLQKLFHLSGGKRMYLHLLINARGRAAELHRKMNVYA